MASGLFERLADFTDRDFESWRAALRLRASTKFPAWTDFNRANIGNLKLELFAHTLDVVSYTMDQLLLETRTTWATQRKSMEDMGKNVAFKLRGAEAATADLEWTIADGETRARDVLIPLGSEVKTRDVQDPVSFFTTAEARILAGNLQVSDVPSKHAETQQDIFTADGSANQEFTLSKTPYLDNSLEMDIAGDTFTQVDNLLNSGPTDKHFVVQVDENDRAAFRFGDGENGVAPSGVITADYETGGGVVGRVDANALAEPVGQFTDTAGVPVRLLVRNPVAASGGLDRMNVEEARVAIPASLITVAKLSVSRDQFESNARLVRGVARALLLTSDDDSTIPEYQANVHIVPVGGGLPSSTLKATVLNELTVVRPPPVGMDVFVLDPNLNIINYSATVYLEQGFIEADVRANIEASLDSFFALQLESGAPNPQIDFGFKIKAADGSPAAEIPFSDGFNAVRDAVGVRKVDKATFVPASDVALANEDFPVLGSITLINGDTSNPF
jgi:hypothetical protein